MASIRRTLSPAYHDRPYQNGTAPSPLSASPSDKLLPNGSGNTGGYKYYYSPHLPLFFTALLSRFLGAVFLPKNSRKGGSWRRPFGHCAVLFMLGFLLGMMPFGHVFEDASTRDFSFEIKPPYVNVRLNEEAADVKVKREELLLDTVSFGVRAQVDEISSSRFDYVPRKPIIVVTATYNRAMQAYFLNRLAQTLRLVQPPLLWIVVEANGASFETAEILRKTGVMYRHLVCSKNLTNVKDRGVHQRNVALEHIELHRLDGIIYFADDDNIYSLELFENLREIR